MKLSELKILYCEFNDNRACIENAIESINEGYVTIEEIDGGEYISHDNRYYSSDDYVILHDGDLCGRNESFWCEGNDEYYHEDDGVRCYMYRSEEWRSYDWANRNMDYLYQGEWYDGDALSYHDLVWCEDIEEVMSEDDAYYHEGDGWYSYPDDTDTYLRGYHDGSYREYTFDNKSQYKIGYEIEKEDQDVLESIDIEDFEEQTEYKWRKESDGSLCSSSGYELISPTFEFNITKIFKHIESNEILVDHINANHSTSCGGHINLSQKGLSGNELFDRIKGYTPLFYALYHGRVDKNYCKGKNNRDLKYENEKYQAIKIHDNRVEFRIISAVPNVKTLKWRSKLIMAILKNPTDDVIQGYYNVDTKFTRLLKETYTDERLVTLKERFKKYTKQFEGLDINN
jgi:hypothetical protein